MSLAAGQDYEIRIDTLTGELTSMAALIAYFKWWCPDLFAGSFDTGTFDVPLQHGGISSGVGVLNSRSITLEGIHTGLVSSANDVYPGMHLQNITRLFDLLQLYINSDMYLDFEVRTGAATTATRRLFVKLESFSHSPIEGTLYTQGPVKLNFEVSDPEFYEAGAALEVHATGASHTAGPLAVVNSGKELQRYTLKIENTDDGDLTDPSVTESVSGKTCAITGTITNDGDYWLIDFLNCTVTKTVGASTTDVIANFTGGFFPIPAAAGAFTVTSDAGGTGAFYIRVDYRRKAAYNVS
jgi:hypothetical protein